LRALRIFFRENQAFEKKSEEGLTRIDAFGAGGQEEKSKSAPLKSARVRHPSGLSASLCGTRPENGVVVARFRIALVAGELPLARPPWLV